MDYVTRGEFDLLQQQLRSDPGEGFAAFRAIPRILDRSYLGSLVPSNGAWQTFYTYTGRGGLLYPDRVLDLALITGRVNNDGALRTFTLRAQINGVTILTATPGSIADGTDTQDRVTFRLLAGGSNANQLVTLESTFASTFDFAAAAEDMSAEWVLTLDVQWSVSSVNLSWARHHALLTLS